MSSGELLTSYESNGGFHSHCFSSWMLLNLCSDLRSIGGGVADIISDSKQFFTQLGALVGVFGTLVNTGSNVIDDYHNGKVASSVFNFVLLISVQIPTISAMLFVFLKDKLHLSLKGFKRVKEDVMELVDDLESLMGTDNEGESESDEELKDGDDKRQKDSDDKREKGSNNKHQKGSDDKHQKDSDYKHEENSDDKHQKGSDDKHQKDSDDKHQKGSDDKHQKDSDDKYQKDSDDKHQKGSDDKHEKNSGDKHEKDSNDKHQKDSHNKHEKDSDNKHQKDSNDRHKKDSNNDSGCLNLLEEEGENNESLESSKFDLVGVEVVPVKSFYLRGDTEVTNFSRFDKKQEDDIAQNNAIGVSKLDNSDASITINCSKKRKRKLKTESYEHDEKTQVALADNGIKKGRQKELSGNTSLSPIHDFQRSSSHDRKIPTDINVRREYHSDKQTSQSRTVAKTLFEQEGPDKYRRHKNSQQSCLSSKIAGVNQTVTPSSLTGMSFPEGEGVFKDMWKTPFKPGIKNTDTPERWQVVRRRKRRKTTLP